MKEALVLLLLLRGAMRVVYEGCRLLLQRLLRRLEALVTRKMIRRLVGGCRCFAPVAFDGSEEACRCVDRCRLLLTAGRRLSCSTACRRQRWRLVEAAVEAAPLALARGSSSRTVNQLY
jgi:hypothetical protein